MRKNSILMLMLLVGWVATAQDKVSFADKLGQLMYLVSGETIDTSEVHRLLATMTVDDKKMEIAPMDYSIYENFTGDILYYLPYKSPNESRFSVELLRMNRKPYYGIQFLMHSKYLLHDNEVVFADEDYAYNTTIKELEKYCTKPLTYKNGKGNEEDSPLLSCIYTNPDSNRSLMYWVVLENPINDANGNTVKEIKIQDIKLWQLQ